MANDVTLPSTTIPAPGTEQREWTVAALLILLAAVPMGAGLFRLTDLAAGGPVTADNARFFASPFPVAVHVVGAVLFTVVGAVQLLPSFRRRRPTWHRVAGAILLPSGLVAALSGLWMSVAYALPDTDGLLLLAFRLVFGTAMVASLVLAARAIRNREFARHGAWMIRAYAIGQGAGTQFLTHLPWVVLVGPPGELPRALLMGTAWIINLAVAERVIRRRAAL